MSFRVALVVSSQYVGVVVSDTVPELSISLKIVSLHGTVADCGAVIKRSHFSGEVRLVNAATFASY